MISRRALLRRGAFASAVMVSASCGTSADHDRKSGDPRRDDTPPSETSDDVRESFDTPLGRIELVTPRGQLDAWRGIVQRAARQVGTTWGRGASITVRVCDEAAFAGLEADLDAGTAAVMTTRGVFLGPALSRSVTQKGRSVVVAHELTHARLGHAGSDRTSWWLKEGIAEWSAAPLAAELDDASRWPQLAEAACSARLTSAPPSGASVGTELGYEWAHAYVTYLVETTGREAVMTRVRAHPSDATAWAKRATAQATPFVTWLRSRLHSPC